MGSSNSFVSVSGILIMNMGTIVIIVLFNGPLDDVRIVNY